MSSFLLKDKKWLYQKYIVEKLSTGIISKILKIKPFRINYMLRKYNISIRTFKEAQINRGSFKYKKLNNRQWLYDKYITKKLTCTKIAKLIGVKNSKEEIITCALKRHKIPTRTRFASRDINRNDSGFNINHIFIEGALLGDAGLEKLQKCNKKSITRFYKKNKYYKHVYWGSTFLYNKNIKNRISKEYTKLNGKIFPIYRARSLYHKELNIYYKRWYPAPNYIKVIPKDVDISPFSLLNWFLDDGTTYYDKKRNKVRIILCTEGFSYDDLIMICHKLKNTYGFNLWPSLTGKINKKGIKVYEIGFWGKQSEKFYKIIGHCPPELVSVLGYKWK